MSVGCTPRHGELKGEVFIVTKGAGNLKLGLVEVALIPEAEINAALEKKKKSIDSTLAKLKTEYERASEEYNSVHQAYERAQQSSDKADKASSSAILSDGYEQAARRAEYWRNEK